MQEIYVVNPNIIDDLEYNKRIDMTDIITKAIKNNNVGIFPMHEQWLDIGSHANYEKAKNNKTPIEILVIGSGNIAIRHIKNIKKIFPNKIIYVLKRTNIQLDKFFYSKNIEVIKSLKEITSMNNKSIALNMLTCK